MAENTEITILHISDLHCGIEDTNCGNFYKKQRKQVIDSFFASYEKILGSPDGETYSPDIIVITGDIGYRGKPEDYNRFFENDGFLDRLLKVTNVDRDKVFVCPGNHDKNLPPEYNKINFRAVRQNIFGDSFGEFAGLFSDYSQAMEAGNIAEYDANDKCDSHYLYGCRKIDIKGKRLCIIAHNTAWLCDYREDSKLGVRYTDQGYLSISPKLVENTIDFADQLDPQPDAVITLFHHPKDWINEDEIKRFDDENTPPKAYNYLTDITDIFCCGHNHRSSWESGRDFVVSAAGTISSNDTAKASCYLIKLIFNENEIEALGIHEIIPEKLFRRYIYIAQWEGAEVNWEFREAEKTTLINETKAEDLYKRFVNKIAEKNEALGQQFADSGQFSEEIQSFIKGVSDCYENEDIPNAEKIEKMFSLQNDFVEKIRGIHEMDLDALNIRDSFLVTLEAYDCSEDTKELCRRIFDSVMKLVDKQNKETDSQKRKLVLDPNNRT